MPSAGEYIHPIERSQICYTEDVLYDVSPRLNNPDQALIALNSKQQFSGIVSPYDLLYANKQYLSSKIEQIAVKPPIISPKLNLLDTAALMYSIHTYSLPIQEGRIIKGIINIDDIRRYISSNEKAKASVLQVIRLRETITINENEKIQEVMDRLSQHLPPWIIVENDQNEPKGILHAGHFNQFRAQNYLRRDTPLQWIKSDVYNTEKSLSAATVNEIFNYYAAPQVSFSKHSEILSTILKPSVQAVIITKNGRTHGLITLRQLCSALTTAQSESSLSGNFYYDSHSSATNTLHRESTQKSIAALNAISTTNY